MEGRGFDCRSGLLDFSLTYSFRPHCGLGDDSALNRNEYQEYILGEGKGGRCVRLTNLSPYADCIENVGASNSCSPKGLSRRVMGWLLHWNFNPLNAELNPICHLLVLLGAHHILHVGRIIVKSHLPFTGIIRSSPYSLRWQDKS